MLKICEILQISTISCNNHKQALGFCIHMIKTHHKICVPVGKHIYFKEYESEPCCFVFDKYLDYIYV
jgi:hypothetical protein